MRLVRIILVLLLTLSAVAVAPGVTGAQAKSTCPSAQDRVAITCQVAQVEGGVQIDLLASMEAAYQRAQAEVSALSVPVTIQAPDFAAYRARIQTLVSAVCTAADPETAKTALDAWRQGRQAIRQELQGFSKGVQDALKGGRSALEAKTKEELKPLAEDAKKQIQAEVVAEHKRLQGNKPQVTPAEQQQLQQLVERKKGEAQEALKAKGRDLRKADSGRMQALGQIFAQLKKDSEGLAGSSQGAKRHQVAQDRKAATLRCIDAVIADAKAKVGGQEGSEPVLAAIDQARATLASALETALASGSEQAVGQAVAAFLRGWAIGVCDTARPKLGPARDQVSTLLEQLNALEPKSPEAQAAMTEVAALLSSIQGADQLCASPPPDLKPAQVSQALGAVNRNGSAAKQAVEALKAAAQKKTS